jgi:hypothetical protein
MDGQTSDRTIRIRRDRDGSTDNGFYRRRAGRLRHATLRRALGQAASLVRPLVAVGIMVAAILAMPARGPDSSSQTADVLARDAVAVPKIVR